MESATPLIVTAQPSAISESVGSRRWLYLAIVFLVANSNYYDYFVISVVLEPIKAEFHVTDTQLGLLTGICFALVYAATTIPISRWADHGNRVTVLSVSLICWSVMTIFCGVAQRFWQLAVARFGVGAAQPGAMPPAVSLISDYFPPERRAIALATLTNGGSTAGWLIGVGIGSIVASHFGWRTAFLVAGIPGLFLALLVRIVLPEPRKQTGFPAQVDENREGSFQALRRLAQKRTYVLTVIGICCYAIFAYGYTVFIPSVMVRSLHVVIADISLPWSAVIGLSNALSAIVGGLLADRLSRSNLKWYSWLPALSSLAGMPLFCLMLMAHSLVPFVAIEGLAGFVTLIGNSLNYMAVLSVCGSRRRAIAIASVFSLIALIGGTVGPFVVGALSDLIRSWSGEDSLRFAMMGLTMFLLPSAAAFYLAARWLPMEVEE